MPRKAPKELEDIPFLRRLYEKEMLNMREIAALLGCSASTVHDRIAYCCNEGRNHRPRKRYYDRDMIRKAHSEGVPMQTIARRLRCSISTIWVAVHEFDPKP